MTAMQHDNIKKSDIDENLQGPKIGLGLYALFPIVQQEVVVTEAHTHTQSDFVYSKILQTNYSTQNITLRQSKI